MMKPQWFQILLSLADRELHGLAIRDEVLERTEGEMHLWPATLYGSLKKLDQRGWIREVAAPADADPGGGNPRYFAITGEGRSALADEVQRMEGLVAAARAKRVGEA